MAGDRVVPAVVKAQDGTTTTTQKALADLEWLAQRSRRILEDPRKQRWHQDTRNQLALIEAEMERLKERAAHH